MATAGVGNNYATGMLDLYLGSGTPATWYYALLTALATDGDADSLVEATWSGYARPSVTNNGTNYPNSTVVSHICQKAVQSAINWGTVSGAGSPITVVGLCGFSASSGGNMGHQAVFGTLASPVTYTLNNGSSLSVASGNLVEQLT
jgi:hypothetical protein